MNGVFSGHVSHRIAVIPANPEAAESDYLEMEANSIRSVFADNANRDTIVKPVRVNSRRQLEGEISELRPTIVHFTAHGSPRREVLLADDSGWLRRVRSRTLAGILERVSPTPSCVVFSGCHVAGGLAALKNVAEAVFEVSLRKFGIDIAPVATRSIYEGLAKGDSYSDALLIARERISGEDWVLEANFDYFERPEDAGDAESRPMFSRANPLALGGSEFTERVGRGERLKGAHGGKDGVTIMARAVAQETLNVKGSSLYKVWFCTNRKQEVKNGLSVEFGPDRSEIVSYGYCDVAIPKHHVIGSVGAPWWKRDVRSFWKNNQLTVSSTTLLQEGKYWSELRNFLSVLAPGNRALLIFIHGYNVTFQNAAIRAAQLGADLDVHGAAAFFSWPSKGTVGGYPADVASVEHSAQALGSFVVRMANEVGAENVYLIAHSMGNRGLLRAFTTIFSAMAPKLKVPLKQLFLAAPDVDKALFQQLAVVYNAIAQRTTMYVSDKDKPLLGSSFLHDYPRAGYTPPITVVGGIDTVEVSKIDLTFLGHGYVAEAERVLQDMKVLIEANLPPGNRFGLKACTTDANENYWLMKP